MHAWQQMAGGIAVAVAIASLLLLVLRRHRRNIDVLFAVVCGSMAASLMSPWLDNAPYWARWAVVIGGSATCNGYWLVSRLLFRGEGGVGRSHVMVAAGVALLIAAYRGSMLDLAGPPAWVQGLDGLLTLASSILLGLTFMEALRGWSPQLSQAERRLRLGFMMLFAGCVLSATILGAMAESWPQLAQARSVVVAACTVAIIGFTHVALRQRRRVPMSQPADRQQPGRLQAAPAAGEARLADALQHHLQVLQVYREPELRVVDLARRLGTAEHRLSRLITQVLGERNFNAMINRHRVQYACHRLSEPGPATILEISGDSGFASLGPFNRAFKAAMGCTPTAYRTTCLKRAAEGSTESQPEDGVRPGEGVGASA